MSNISSGAIWSVSWAPRTQAVSTSWRPLWLETRASPSAGMMTMDVPISSAVRPRS
ncbi:hypothetical protein [Nocardiopsis dassonvillei]|uniref:hypothetical protein n=1 Tax=Nocardiopsis dassonvillei TaxID=2014 RepID=UPI00019EF795|nr:hypothetical protein [Nocardiopsis dassonvillei]